MELLLIIVLALIVFGPAKLPEIMGQVGKAVNDFRRATSDLSEEFNKTIQAELQETKAVMDEAKAAMTDARTAVTDVHASVNSAVTSVPAPTRLAEPALSGTNGTNGTAASTVSAATEEPTPALADTTQWSWETAAPPEPRATEEVAAGEPIATASTASASETGTASATVTSDESPSPVVGDAPKGDELDASAPASKPKTPARDDLAPPY